MKHFIVFLPAILCAAACGQSAAPTGDDAKMSSACEDAPAGQVTLVDPWIRTASADAKMSAAYMVVCNRTDQPITIASVNTSIAGAVEMHETKRDKNDVASMSPVDAIAVESNASAELRPGGKHVMLFDLQSAIGDGDLVPLTVTLQTGKSLTIEAQGRDAHRSHTHH